MSLVKLNMEPDRKQLRQFGMVSLFAIPAVAWIAGAGQTVLIICGLIGIAIGFSSLFVPRALKIPFIALTVVTAPIGIVVGELVVLIVYFFVFFPVGLWFRLIGRETMSLKFDPNAKSYWTTKQKSDKLNSYFRQF